MLVGRCEIGPGGGSQCLEDSPWENALCMECGTQLMPMWGPFAIPTKTPLALSQSSGRLCSFWRVPLQVLRTSFPRRALSWYLFQLVRVQSSSSLSLKWQSCSFLFPGVGGFCLVCFQSHLGAFCIELSIGRRCIPMLQSEIDRWHPSL